jgi:hypothetical protein
MADLKGKEGSAAVSPLLTVGGSAISAQAEKALSRSPELVSVGAGEQSPEERLAQRCHEMGVTEAHAAELCALGVHAVQQLASPSSRICMRTLVTFAALGHGDLQLADSMLALPGEPESPELRLLDLSARLYRVCVESEQPSGQPLAAMNALTEALLPVLGVGSPLARLSRGYAGLTSRACRRESRSSPACCSAESSRRSAATISRSDTFRWRCIGRASLARRRRKSACCGWCSSGC